MEDAGFEKLKLEDGRILVLSEPNAKYYAKCIEMANGVEALIPLFEMMFCVVKIDNDVITPPNNRLKADSLAGKIGRRGLDLLGVWYQNKLYPELNEIREKAAAGEMDEEEAAAAINEKRRERLKNAQLTQD